MAKAKRKCHGKTVKGKPCQAIPFKPGTVIENVTVTGKWCRTHDPDLPDSARIQGPQPGSGRPPVPRATDIQRRLVEEHIEKVIRPYWISLGYDVVRGEDGGLTLVELEDGGVKMFGESKEGIVMASPYEDIGAQMAAAEKMQDRVFGRPKQSQDVHHSGSVRSEAVEIPDDPKRKAEVAAILANAGALEE